VGLLCAGSLPQHAVDATTLVKILLLLKAKLPRCNGNFQCLCQQQHWQRDRFCSCSKAASAMMQTSITNDNDTGTKNDAGIDDDAGSKAASAVMKTSVTDNDDAGTKNVVGIDDDTALLAMDHCNAQAAHQKSTQSLLLAHCLRIWKRADAQLAPLSVNSWPTPSHHGRNQDQFLPSFSEPEQHFCSTTSHSSMAQHEGLG